MATSVVAWPKTLLPQGVLVEGFKLSQGFGVVRTPMDTGLARQRKRFSNPPYRTPVRWLMTSSQVAYFRAWLSYKAAFGGAFFSLPLVLDTTITDYDVRFIAQGQDDISYTPTAGGKYWYVQATLEIKVPLLMSADVFDLLSVYPYDDLMATSAYLTVETPILYPAIEWWWYYFPYPDMEWSEVIASNNVIQLNSPILPPAITAWGSYFA